MGLAAPAWAAEAEAVPSSAVAGGGSWGDHATTPHLHFTPYKMGTWSKNRFEHSLWEVLEIFPCGAQQVVELPQPEF